MTDFTLESIDPKRKYKDGVVDITVKAVLKNDNDRVVIKRDSEDEIEKAIGTIRLGEKVNIEFDCPQTTLDEAVDEDGDEDE